MNTVVGDGYIITFVTSLQSYHGYIDLPIVDNGIEPRLQEKNARNRVCILVN